MQETKRPKLRRFETVNGYLFISPWLIGFLLFTMAPMVASLYFAFTRYSILSSPEWIGLGNFIEMFTNDERYLAAWKATLTFVFVAVPLRLIFALAVAVLLNTKLKFLGFFRATFYLPTLIGGSVAVAIMWRQLFGMEGAFNSILSSLFGINNPISWITHPSTAMWSLILLSVWQFGSAMLIFLAGLKQVPISLYEAADIDGAGRWLKFRKITLPLLSPVLLFNLIMGIISGFKVFTEGLIVTGGGPFDKTLFYVLYLYEKSFKYYEMGYGSAMAWMLLIATGILTAIVFLTSRNWVFYESGRK